MSASKVPDIVIGRLPLYMRALSEMATEGKEITSSQELGTRLGLSSAQIRKDLSQFGEFGKQGTGYNIRFLTEQLKSILHVERIWEVVLVGVGDLGRAVANYAGFLDRGFRIALVFDNDPAKVGKPLDALDGSEVAHFGTADEMRTAIQRLDARLGVLCVPASEAQRVADILVEAGIEGLLNFAPVSLSLPEGVALIGVDLAIHLEQLSFQAGAVQAGPREG